MKRLALSQLTYILTPLATNQKFINEINDIFIVFCNWNNKRSRCVKFLQVTFQHFMETVFLSSCNSGLFSLFQTQFNRELKQTRRRLHTSSENITSRFCNHFSKIQSNQASEVRRHNSTFVIMCSRRPHKCKTDRFTWWKEL